MSEATTIYEWAPRYVWQTVIVVGWLLVSAAVLLLLAWRRRGRRGEPVAVDPPTARAGWIRLAQPVAVVCSMLAALLMALAALDLTRERRENSSAPHVVVLMDESASLQRDAESRRADIALFSKRLRSALVTDRETPDFLSLVRFSGSAVAIGDVPQDQIEARVFEVGPPNGGTNIATALDFAGSDIARRERPGLVVLWSDGNQTDGDALRAAQRLAAHGVPVHVSPVASPGPALFLHGTAVPATVRADEEGTIRALVKNSSDSDQSATLKINYHHNVPRRPSPEVLTAEQTRYRAGEHAGAAPKLTFAGRGLQAVEVVLENAAGIEHRVGMPVYVQGKSRLLAIGRDTAWTNMLDPKKWEVVTAEPGQAASVLKESDIDVIALSNVLAERFDQSTLKEMRRQVHDLGTGLLLINGDHGSADEEQKTVLMSYMQTELEELLPVHPGPREHTKEPPARRIVIIIDCSGSMSAWMGKVNEICDRLLSLARPIDTVEVMSFSDDAKLRLKNRTALDPAGRQLALAAIRGIGIEGGTNPVPTLALIKQLQIDSGAVLFLSDGEFTTDNGYARQLRQSVGPDVETYAYAMGQGNVTSRSSLHEFTHKIPVTYGFNASGIEFEAVKPKKRTKFFERAPFLSGVRSSDLFGKMIPNRTLAGHAVSTLRADNKTELIGVHPKQPDPVLAFRECGRGKVGVFACGVPKDWEPDVDAKRAVTAWCDYVSPLAMPDRYWIEATRDGVKLRVRLFALKDQQPVNLEHVGLELITDGKTLAAVTLRPDRKGVFDGTLLLPDTLPHGLSYLMVKEHGQDELTRPQRLPIVFPPEATRQTHPQSEDWTQGTNTELLKSIAQAGGGRILDREDDLPNLGAATRHRFRNHLWPMLSAASAVLLTVAVLLESCFVNRWR
ncbi:MAG: VWA domain-containing protein [Planctomycetaceae bacterium]